MQTKEVTIAKNIFSILQLSWFFKTDERANMQRVIVGSEFLTFWETQ